MYSNKESEDFRHCSKSLISTALFYVFQKKPVCLIKHCNQSLQTHFARRCFSVERVFCRRKVQKELVKLMNSLHLFHGCCNMWKRNVYIQLTQLFHLIFTSFLDLLSFKLSHCIWQAWPSWDRIFGAMKTMSCGNSQVSLLEITSMRFQYDEQYEEMTGRQVQ